MRITIILLCVFVCQSALTQNIYETIIYDSLAVDPDYQFINAKKKTVNDDLRNLASVIKVHPMLEKDMSQLFHDVQMGRVDLVETQLEYPYMQKVLTEDNIAPDSVLELTEQFNAFINAQQRLENIYAFKRLTNEGHKSYEPTNQLKREVRKYDLNNGEDILEIGSGSTQLGRCVGSMIKEANIYLNDIDTMTLKQMYYTLECLPAVQKNIEKNSNEYFIVRGHPKSTGIEGHTFDKIIIRNAFHHFEHPFEMLRSIKKSMDEQTVLIIREKFNKNGNVCCTMAMSQLNFENIFEENGLRHFYKKNMKDSERKEVCLYKFSLGIEQ